MFILSKLWRGTLILLAFLLENPVITIGIFFTIVIWIFITQVKKLRKSHRLCKEIRQNPSNENVKAYVSLVKKISIPNHPSWWNTLRQTYYVVRDLESIDYDIRVKLCEVLQKKGVSGVHHPKQYHYQQSEEKIRQAGQEGEKQVAYALKWLDKNRFKVFNNIKLSDGGEPQEFDSIVIGDQAAFNIETKNYIGDLTIDEEGNWYRIVNGNKFGTENPIFQVKRHHKVLHNILEGKLPIVDLIVWTNIESVIEGVQYSPVKVIKIDQLHILLKA